MATPELKENEMKAADVSLGKGQLGEIRDLLKQALEARKEYDRTAGLYAGLVFVEAKLEAERALVKLEAIKRLMGQENPVGKPDANGIRPYHSASSAEAVAVLDDTYAAHLKLQRETVRDKDHAHSRLVSAKMRVDISLAAVKSLGGFQ